jgi:hypothetical protein
MSIEEARKRAYFADWFYLRTGERVTSDRGLKAMSAFLAGLPIKVVQRKSGYKVSNGQIEIRESKQKQIKKF